MTTYDTLIEYLKRHHTVRGLRTVANDLPISYRQIQRMVRRAEQRGQITVCRDVEEHGHPLVLREVTSGPHGS